MGARLKGNFVGLILVFVFVGDGPREVAIVSLCRPCLMRLIGLEGVESIAGLDADDGDRMSGERRYGNEDETDEVCRELL